MTGMCIKIKMYAFSFKKGFPGSELVMWNCLLHYLCFYFGCKTSRNTPFFKFSLKSVCPREAGRCFRLAWGFGRRKAQRRVQLPPSVGSWGEAWSLLGPRAKTAFVQSVLAWGRVWCVQEGVSTQPRGLGVDGWQQWGSWAAGSALP